MATTMSYVDMARLGRTAAQADIRLNGDRHHAAKILLADTPRVRALQHSAVWWKSDHAGRRVFLLSYYATVAACAEVVEATIGVPTLAAKTILNVLFE